MFSIRHQSIQVMALQPRCEDFDCCRGSLGDKMLEYTSATRVHTHTLHRFPISGATWPTHPIRHTMQILISESVVQRHRIMPRKMCWMQVSRNARDAYVHLAYYTGFDVTLMWCEVAEKICEFLFWMEAVLLRSAHCCWCIMQQHTGWKALLVVLTELKQALVSGRNCALQMAGKQNTTQVLDFNSKLKLNTYVIRYITIRVVTF